MLRQATQSLLTAILLSLATVPATAADVAPATEVIKGKSVALDVDATKKLNIFFSNFSEAYLKPFEAGKLTDDALIEFGIKHNLINYPKVFHANQLAEEEVNKACKKYFGTVPKAHHAVGEYAYTNGRYTVQPASGEAFTFSQIAELTDNGDGTYNAKVNDYTASSGFTGDVHGTPAIWKAAGD
ncbi:TPA: hypothetical protein DDW35_11020, partial [Candidatus Sumerlaeota bacterium]|nr:hypothetical protein [Candidatus Sumerlaeota bacterium]